MTLFQVDILIKQLRKNNNLSQEQLSEGICTKDTLSRIERGLRRPDWYIFERLMQRLGEDPQKYFTDIATKKDKEILDVRDKLKYLLRDKNIDEAETLIEELNNNKSFQEGSNLQFLLKSKATLAFNKKDYHGMYNYAVDAIKITKPHFNEELIDTYILFYDEIIIINQIATAHFYISSTEKSTDTLLMLKASMDKGYIDYDEKIRTYITILYNITKNLGILKRYDECLEICDIGIELCQKYQNTYLHPMLLYYKACCLLYLEKKEEGISILEKAYALFIGYDRLTELAEIKSYVEKEFGIISHNLNYSIT